MKMYLFDKAQKVRRWLTDKDFIEARLTEQINAACELKFSMPVKNTLDGSLFYAAVPHPSGNGYVLCKIISESKQDDLVEYEAIEAAYDELQAYNYIKDVRPHDRNPGEMLSIALQGTRWTSGVVYGGATGSTNFYYINTLEAIKKIVELFGLEVTFTVTIDPQTNQITRRQVNLYSQQGQRTGKRFEYGSNLLNVTREEARDGLITALIGRGKGEQVSEGQDGSPDGYGRRIDFADIVWSKANGNPADKPYGQEYVEDKEATAAFGFDNGKPRIGLQIFEDITDKAELLKATWAALQTLKRPQVSFKASVGDVGSLGLGDTVAIIRHNIGIEYFTRVYKVDHNLLDEKQNEIELGDDFDGDSITRTVSNVAGSVSQVQQVASYAATAANGKNTVNYGSPQPQVAAEGDIWYKDLGNGETDMMQYRNGNWVLVTSTRDLRNVEKKVNDTKAALDKEISSAFAAVEDEAKKRKEIDDQVNQALASAKDDFNTKWQAASQAVIDEKSARSAADSAVTAKINAANSNFDAKWQAANQAIIDEKSARSAADSAATEKINAANSNFDAKWRAANQAIIDEKSARSAADSAATEKINAANSNFDEAWNLATQANAKADSNAAHFSNIDAGGIKTGTLNANLIKTGSMSADRISGGSLDFNNITSKNLSASQLTAGTIDGNVITVKNLKGEAITSGIINANLIKTGSMSADLIVGGSLDFSSITAKNLSASQLTAGTIDGNVITVKNLKGEAITSGILNANLIKTGLMSADRISGGSLDFNNITAKNLSASRLTAGTIDGGVITVKNLKGEAITSGIINANLIKTGSMSADRIVGGSLDFNNITAKNLSASKIVSGTLDTTKVTISGSLSANLIKSGTMSADRISGGSISASLIAGGTLDFNKAEISNLSADDITSGTLDAGNVHVINIDADEITSGKLSGVNGYFDLKNGDLYSSYENHSLKISNGEVFFKAPSTKPVSKGKIVNIGSITSYKKNSNFQGNSLTIRGNDGLILSTFSAELGLGATTGSLTFGDYTNGQYDYPFSGSIIQAGYDGIVINGGFYTGLEQYGSEESYEKYNKRSSPMRAALVAGFPPDDYYRMENFYGSYYSGWRQPGIYIDGAPENNKNFSMIHIRAGNYIELETTGESNIFLDKDGVSVNNKLTANGNVTVLKDFITLGSKNAAVETSQGTTLINAYETAEYYFGDIGESATDESGICKVMIDTLFLETVNTSIPYQVFVSPYSDDKVWVAERYDTFFVVKSDKPNAKFTWELKAKRLGYENDRLEVVNIKKPEVPNEQPK